MQGGPGRTKGKSQHDLPRKPQDGARPASNTSTSKHHFFLIVKGPSCLRLHLKYQHSSKALSGKI